MSTELRQLSEREQEILRLVATGATNQQIANELNISINTVKVHLRNIFGKVGVASRTEATVYAMRQGLVAVEEAESSPLSEESEPEPEEAARPLQEEAETFDQSTPLAEPQFDEVENKTQPNADQRVAASPPERHLNRKRLYALVGFVLLISLIGILAIAFPQVWRQQATSPSELPVQPERWRSHAPMLKPRTAFAVAALDDSLYVMGGATPAGPSDAAERFDIANNVWVPLSNKPTAVSQVEAVAISGSIFVPGGEGKDGTVLSIFEAYDPRAQRWDKLPALPAPRSRYALASVEGRLYLFGGWDGTNYQADVLIYDPATRVWTKGTPMPTARRQAGAAVVGKRIYVIGGENESGPLTLNQRYDPTDEGPGGHPWASTIPLPDAIAAPAVAGIANIMIVFDPIRRQAIEYVPDQEAWMPIPIPENIGLSSRIVPLSVSIIMFGAADTQPGAVNEYQVMYTTFLPSPR